MKAGAEEIIAAIENLGAQMSAKARAEEAVAVSWLKGHWQDVLIGLGVLFLIVKPYL
jgi:hypothetical protein